LNPMNRFRQQSLIGYLAALAGVAAATATFKLVIPQVNTTTVAMSYLLVVLVVASAFGLGPAILASIAGMVCFNYYFLPPIGSFTIRDPQNWVAIGFFLVTAVIASKLSTAARSREHEAENRREEVWKLYQLSRAIIVTPDSDTVLSSISRQVVEIFSAAFCAVYLPDDSQGWRRLAAASSDQPISFAPSQSTIEEVFATGEAQLVVSGIGAVAGRKQHPAAAYAPLKVGVRSIGIMVLVSPTFERATIEAVAGLVALALERARFLEQVSRTEALRQSDELKSALLASVSHDLRTPLTSIRAAIDNILQYDSDWDTATLKEFHAIISEEVERLTRLIDNLLEMARIEAGELRPAREWGAIDELFDNALDRCSTAVRDHRVATDLDPDLPLVKIDVRLIAEALTNLIENAAKYSAPRTLIRLGARLDDDRLIISVTDEGPGIGPDEIGQVFDKFYRGATQLAGRAAGTGMGLAIARGIVEAHGGSIRAESLHGHGARFEISIPTEHKKMLEGIGAKGQ
jgi:two-component system sensor histidine kinase KdpD